MAAKQSQDIPRRAEEIYDQQLRSQMEAQNPGWFVAIEPDSGRHFLGQSLSEAVAAARQAIPDHICYVIRIGHDVAIHLGGCQQ